MRILLIEDDEILASVLLQSLSQKNYVVDIVHDGQMGWECTQDAKYDLILMNVGLPKVDGITLCQRLRGSGCLTPILLMTAKDATSDRIRGLDAGADDYVIKPLDLGELQARVRALLRRGDTPRTPVLQVGGLILDPSTCQVTYEGNILDLTPKEYSLLELLLRNPLRVFSRGSIIDHLWGFDDPPQEETVKSHIKGLRQKLKVAGAVDWIENVYGLGYRLNPPKTTNSKIFLKSTVNNFSAIPYPAPIEQQFHQALISLWSQYQGLMRQRLAVLQQTAAALASSQLTPDLHQAAEQAAHKLAGVLGMFEQETGTEIARQIEQILSQNNHLLPTQKHKLLSLISELTTLLNLMGEKLVSRSTPTIEQHYNSRLLLIDTDWQIGLQLQQLAQPGDWHWQQITTIEAATNYLQTTSPDLVVLNIDEVGVREQSLVLLSDLAKRTPPVPVLVLAAVDGLVDRVTVARSGARGFLVKPVTSAQIWDVASQILQRTRSQVVHVLAVDDDPLILQALRSLLEPWGIYMTTLDDPTGFWEVLQSTVPDLLILDVEMPQISGIELCQAVRTDPQWQELPIVFLTAHREIETVQQVFTVGGDDYVVKPIVEAELLARINHRLERNRLMRAISTKEPITGLLNQLQSNRNLQHLISQAQRYKYPFCLVLLKVTDLHQINIKHSHCAGNQVLQRWGRIFQSAFCSGENLGYWGYGEFVVGISGLTKIEVNDRLSDVLTSLRQQIFTDPHGDRFQVVCHFAVVEYPRDGLTLESLYQVASSALKQH
jgi:diguanylate cyclase (GGDEF)-like protein